MTRAFVIVGSIAPHTQEEIRIAVEYIENTRREIEKEKT